MTSSGRDRASSRADGTPSEHFNKSRDGDGTPVRVRDEKNRFAGDFIETTASIEWSARKAGFRFKSDPETTNEFSEIGRERNGVFFS